MGKPVLTKTRAKTSGAVMLAADGYEPGMYLLADALPDTVVRIRQEMSGRAAEFAPKSAAASRRAAPLGVRERLDGLVLQMALIDLVHRAHGTEVRWAASGRRFAGARYKGQRAEDAIAVRVAYAFVGRRLVAMVCPLRDSGRGRA